MAHGYHPVRCRIEGTDERTGHSIFNHELGCIGRSNIYRHIRVHATQLGSHIGSKVVDLGPDSLLILGIHGNHRHGLARYGVAQVTAVDGTQVNLVTLHAQPQEAGQQFVGIAAAQVNIATRVAAQQVLHLDPQVELTGR